MINVSWPFFNDAVCLVNSTIPINGRRYVYCMDLLTAAQIPVSYLKVGPIWM